MKSVPFDLQAEQSALGACLLDREAIIALAGWLTPDHFYLEQHALIYEAMLACFNRREPPDFTTVMGELRRQERLDLVGGISALIELSDSVVSAVHVEYYGRLVEQAAGRRQLIVAGGKIAALGYDETEELGLTFDQAEQTLFEVTQRSSLSGGLLTAQQVMNAVLAHLQSSADPALPTGLKDLDRRIIGWRPSRLYVAAGRPGMGKSGFALSTMIACCKAGGRPLLFSLEMTHEELGMRMVASLNTGISSQAIEALTLRNDQLERVVDTMGVVSGWNFLTSDISGEHLAALRGKARRAHAESPLSLIIVDYLQLIQTDGENRQQEIATIARGLKNLARELRVPILALAQLNRAVEARASKVPMLSDLRESGEIEQAADCVLFIHREEVYDKDTDKKGIAELHIAKQRNGPLGTVACAFDGPTTTFRDLAKFQPVEGY